VLQQQLVVVLELMVLVRQVAVLAAAAAMVLLRVVQELLDRVMQAALGLVLVITAQVVAVVLEQ
jgi:hypothetical protein